MGGRIERAFVRQFNATDHWWAQRAAASGAGVDSDLPDVTFAHDGIAFAGEEKTTGEPYVYVTEDELEPLEDYADAYGMQAVIVGRFKQERAYYIWAPGDMERTDAGTLRGDPDGGEWAAKVAEPDGAADGILPEELTAFHLHHGLNGMLGKGITEPPENSSLQDDGGEADADG